MGGFAQYEYVTSKNNSAVVLLAGTDFKLGHPSHAASIIVSLAFFLVSMHSEGTSFVLFHHQFVSSFHHQLASSFWSASVSAIFTAPNVCNA